jgi:serine/threonine protein kinase
MMDSSPTTPLQSSESDPVDLLYLASNVQIQGNSTSLYDISEQKRKSRPLIQIYQNLASLQPLPPPQFLRRPSHDLFECIEQTPDKHLSEDQARYIFAQVVEAAYYLDSQGITHRDIKDENLIIDKDLKVMHGPSISESEC